MAEDQTPRKRRWKKILYRLGVAFIILLSAALIFLHTRTAGTIVLRTADRFLTRSAGLSLEARNVRLRPFTLSVKLEDLALRSVTPEDAWLQSFTAEKVEVDASWAIVFGKTIRLQKLLVVRPRLKAIAPPTPTSEPEAPFAPKPSGDPKPAVSTAPEIRIDAFELIEGILTIDGGPSPFHLALRDVESAVVFDAAAASHSGRLDIGNGRLVFEDSEIAIRETRALFRFDGQTVFIDTFRISTTASSLEAIGSTTLFGAEPSFHIQARTSISLGEFLPFMEAPVSPTGILDASAEIKSRAADIVYTGRIEGRELYLPDLGPADFHTGFEGTGSALRLAEIRFRSDAGVLEGGADLVLSGPGEFRIDARWKDLLPDRWASIFRAEIPFDSMVSEGRIDARWPSGAFEDAVAEASIFLKPAPVSYSAPIRTGISPQGRLDFKASRGRISGYGRISGAGVHLGFTGTVDRMQEIDAKISLAAPDIWATARALIGPDVLAASLPPGFGPVPEQGGSADVRGHILGSAANPIFAVTVEAGDIPLGDLQVSEIRVDAAGDTSGLDIKRLSARLNEGRFDGSGRITFQEGALFPGPGTRGAMTVSNVSLDSINAFLPPDFAGKISGILRGEGEMSFEQEGIRAEFKAEATPLTFHGVAFDRMTARGRLDSKEFAVDSLILESRDAALNGYFGWDIAEGAFHASLIGTRVPLAMAGILIPGGPPIEGTARFVIEGEGTFTEPIFTLSIALDNAAAGGFRIPRLEFDAFGDGSAAAAILSVPFLNLNAEAGIAFEETYAVHGKITMPETSLPALFPGFPVEATGPDAESDARLSAEIVFDYPILQPHDFQAEGMFSGRDMVLSAERLPGWPFEETGSGTLEGRFTVRGDPADIPSLEAELELSDFHFSAGGLDLRGPAPIRFRLQEGLIRLEDLALEADRTEIDLSGVFRIAPEPAIDARLRLKTDLVQFDAFVAEARIGGTFEADLAVSGTPSHPDIRGRAHIQDVFARVRDFPLNLTGIQGEMIFEGSAASLTQIRGAANAGSFSLEGRIDYGGFQNTSIEGLRLSLRNFDLAFPPGFRSVSDADLELRGLLENMTLSGEARILRGFYREDIHPGVELLGMIRYAPPPSPTDLPPLLQDLNLNIGLTSVESIRVRNNVADIELEARLRVSGTPAFPLLSGQIRSTRIGQAYLGNRRFTIESVRLEYLGTELTDFLIDIVAHTQIRWNHQDIDIRLHLTGPIDRPTYALTSANAANLSSDDLAFLLLTGRTMSDISGSALDSLGGQMIQYFATPLTSPITEGLKDLLKAEDVVIEPLNIASEEDPGARLTFRKRVSDRAALTYSVDITRSQRQTWILDYELSRSFQISGFHKDEGTFGSSFKHTLTIGGRRSPGRVGDPAISEGGVFADIRYEGDPAFPPSLLEAKAPRLRTGRQFSYGDLYSSVEDLLDFYRDRGYANAVISPRIDQKVEGRIDVTLDITAGIPASLLFRGDVIPKRLKNDVREAWRGEFPESANMVESRALLLESLRLRRLYAAEVSVEKRDIGGRVLYVFTVRKGSRYRIRSLDIRGGEPLSARDVQRTVGAYAMARTKGLWNLIIDTRAAQAALDRRYQDLGYRDTEISPPRISADHVARRLDIRLDISAGPRSFIQDVVLEGLESFEKSQVESLLALRPGSAFSPTRLQEDRNTLITLYRGNGFVDAWIEARLIPRGEDADVDIVYKIHEGSRHTVGPIEVQGNTRTRSAFILKEAGLVQGAPVSLETFARSKKRLYDTGVFQGVDIFHSPPEDARENGDTVIVAVEEAPPLAVTYGLRYNTEENLEGFGELSFANLLGGGRRGFLSYRENARQTDLRFSLRSPYLFGVRFNTLTSLYAKKDVREFFATETRGASIQQEMRLPLDFTLTYLYRFNRIHTYELVSLGPFPFDFTINLSEVALNLIRDKRDDRLNPRDGSFFSASLTYAPEALGSDLPYVSFFAQYMAARSLGGRCVWSSGLRLGLADAYDQVLIPGKRFYAGGGNSVRGFRLDSLGPIDPFLGMAEGGEAVLIFNNEFRFPIFSMVGGAVFWDFGNVYSTARNLTLSDLRHGAGVGLRADSPIGLLRLDLGFNLHPRPGEPRSVLFFSIGQAF